MRNKALRIAAALSVVGLWTGALFALIFPLTQLTSWLGWSLIFVPIWWLVALVLFSLAGMTTVLFMEHYENNR